MPLGLKRMSHTQEILHKLQDNLDSCFQFSGKGYVNKVYSLRKCLYAFILDGASWRMSWSWAGSNGLRQTWYDLSCK